MKKSINIILMLILLLFWNEVYAGELTKENKNATLNEIKREINDIEIIWDQMTFDFEVKEKYTYNEITHDFDLSREEKWNSNNNIIRLKNDSNKVLNYNISAKLFDEFDDLNINKIKNKLSPKEKRIEMVTINGNIDKKYTNYVCIGNLNIEID